MVIGWLAAQAGSVSDEPRIRSELNPGDPIRTPNTGPAAQTSTQPTAHSGREAIVDRVLLAGQGSFELFYRAP